MQTQKSFGGPDRFRAAAAFLVIAIHTSPLASINGDADFFLTRILARTAVPFFFMVTGCFALSGWLFSRDSRELPKILGFLKKTLVLYGISILLYLPLGLYAGHYHALTPGGVLRMLVFDGTFYHLWYFPACILGVLLLCLLRRLLPLRAAAFICLLLYLMGLLGDSWYGLTAFLPGLSGLYSLGFRLFSYTRNGLFLAPVFLLLGALAGRRGRAAKTGPLLAGFLLSFLAMTAEGFTLRALHFQRHDSMYMALVPCMYFLFRLLLSWRVREIPFLRPFSAWVYLLHPLVIAGIHAVSGRMGGLSFLNRSGPLFYLATAALTALASLGTARVLTLRRPSPGSRGRAWIELDARALRRNVKLLSSRLPDSCRLMPAVKANAYGHGAVWTARTLNRMGVHAFCVASPSEGVELRKAHIRGEILILGYTHPDQFPLLRRWRLTQTVLDASYGALLNQYGRKLKVHVALDSGMHRLGEPCGHKAALKKIFQMEHLEIRGLFSHLCVSDGHSQKERDYTLSQAESFYRTASALCAGRLPRPKLHLLASYGVLNYPELAGDYARVGIALYGVLSTRQDTKSCPLPLEPVLSLKARITAVKELKAGESAGYGLAFTARQVTRIAVLSIGYADGLPRSLSCGQGWVLIAGQRAPILGRICMDQTLVDISEIPAAAPGGTAVLIGSSGKETITACDLAAWAGTISNEILSRLGSRLERVLLP